MRLRILTTISLGLLAAACQAPYQSGTNTAGHYGAAYQTANQVCAEYGFSPGTAAFNRCVTSTQAARANARMNRDYSPAMLTADARNACNSYGLAAGTSAYDRCVNREIEARSYREAAVQPPYHVDQYGYRVDAQGYRVDANGYRVASQTTTNQPAYQPVPQSYSHQQVSSDEFGNRYDAQGNRVNASGQVIQMRQSRN
jgi:hypothetical protein